MDRKMADHAAEVLKAVAHPVRLQIVELLEKKEMCVGDIVDAFDMSQPTISHHLNVLKQFGLVTSRKDGKQVYYAINRDNVVQCCGRLIAKFDAEEACET